MTDGHAVCSGSRCIYDGTDCQFEVEGLQANKQYTYKVRAYTEGDVTSFSDTITVTTEEDCEFPVVLQSLLLLQLQNKTTFVTTYTSGTQKFES